MSNPISRFGLTVTLLFSVFAVYSAAESKETPPPGYVYLRSANGVTYGQPKELSAIRGRLTFLCTGGRKASGLGPAEAFELIQIHDYAIAEGSCGNPELHLVLKRIDGAWQTSRPRCGIGGGVTPNYGRFGLYDALVTHCKFPLTVVCQIIGIRSSMPIFAREQPTGSERACVRHSPLLMRKASPETNKPEPATTTSAPNTNQRIPAPNSPPVTPTPPSCPLPHVDARVTHAVLIKYPDSAREQHATGTVQVKVTLRATGEVLKTSVYRSSGNEALDAAALEAAQASSYSAEIEDCQPVGGSYLFRADFHPQPTPT